MKKIIFHIDVNSAFLSWEAAYRIRELGETEDLRMIPSVVGGSEESRHGIVLAKSESAKKYGVTTGEPLVDARRKCPCLKTVPSNFPIYVKYSNAMMKILEDCAIALITWTCVKHWFGISIQPGVLYVFVTYIQKLFEPITRIVENVEIVQEAGVSINKIYDILEGKDFLEKLDGGITLDKVEGKIEFKNVWFSYDNKNWVLKDVSFVIEPGQSIALVGKTGSGKTTIVNLINRFYNIQKGEILIDGVNINEINLRSLREHIGMILQDPFIFADSIKENIKMNLPISDEDVKKSIELASAEEFVDNLPNGINEVAKERGTSFSAGQKQLIAFARVFAHNPDIFILDEATANIDTYTESLIQKSINKISKDKTSIFIAHRLSTIVNVDKIIVLMNGEIVEQGNHNELVATGGYYSKLYNSYYESLG